MALASLGNARESHGIYELPPATRSLARRPRFAPRPPRGMPRERSGKCVGFLARVRYSRVRVDRKSSRLGSRCGLRARINLALGALNCRSSFPVCRRRALRASARASVAANRDPARKRRPARTVWRNVRKTRRVTFPRENILIYHRHLAPRQRDVHAAGDARSLFDYDNAFGKAIFL